MINHRNAPSPEGGACCHRAVARPFLRPALAGLLLVLGRTPGLSAQPGAAPTQRPPAFRFADVSDGSLGLWEGGQPVLVYNYGIIRQPGVPADRARSTYIHPLYGLDGEVLTDDFPRDHYHHRGLFWAWPHVGRDGRQYDLWMLHGIAQRFVRWLERRADPDGAVLGVENGWYVGDQKVMREKVWLRILPATATGRAIDCDFTWTPVGQPVTLAGAEGKSYGGLTLRFAPGTNTVITTPRGSPAADLYMTNLPWADLTRRLASDQRTSGAAIFVHPSHPGFPPQWLTRHYGVLCLGWPGVQPKTFSVGEPIHCRYRVWIHRSQPTVAQLERAYDAYQAAAPFAPEAR